MGLSKAEDIGRYFAPASFSHLKNVEILDSAQAVISLKL